ncbi:hypothetical protein DFH07DRAFT_873114, partial [Mycena maculata]
MPVVRSIIPYRKSRRLRQTDPKNYADDDGVWETYDESLLVDSDPCPVVKSEPEETLNLAQPGDLPILHKSEFEETLNLAQPSDLPILHIPRPRNAFICFRSAYVKAEKRVSARPASIDQTVMSRGAADVWRGMSEDERLPYVEMAQTEKEAHQKKYPNYRYAPGSASGVPRKAKKPKA